MGANLGCLSRFFPAIALCCVFFRKSVFTISREGVQDADRDGLLGANRSNSLAIARICNNADRPIPRLHTRVEIVNTL